MPDLMELLAYNAEPIPLEYERRFRRVDVDFQIMRDSGCKTLADVATLLVRGRTSETERIFPVDMPEDAQIVRAAYAMYCDTVAFMVYSREFEPVKEYEMIPQWNPSYREVAVAR